MKMVSYLLEEDASKVSLKPVGFAVEGDSCIG